MTVTEFISSLEYSSFGAAMRGELDFEWAFPIVEIFHVMALAVVFGSIAMVDLRLLGLSARNMPVSKLSAEILPYTWTAYLLAAVTGTMMFISNAHNYLTNVQFILKFVAMLLAGVNMAVFHLGAYRRAAEWDTSLPPPPAARIAGGLSILLWVAVVFFGRWIGFTSNPS